MAGTGKVNGYGTVNMGRNEDLFGKIENFIAERNDIKEILRWVSSYQKCVKAHAGDKNGVSRCMIEGQADRENRWLEPVPRPIIFGASEICEKVEYAMTAAEFMSLVEARLNAAGIKGGEKNEFMRRFEVLYLQVRKGSIYVADEKNRSCKRTIVGGVFCTTTEKMVPGNEERTGEFLSNVIDGTIDEYRSNGQGKKYPGIAMTLAVESARTRVEEQQLGLVKLESDYAAFKDAMEKAWEPQGRIDPLTGSFPYEGVLCPGIEPEFNVLEWK